MFVLLLLNLINAKKIEYNKAQDIAIKWMERVTNKRLKVVTNKVGLLANYRQQSSISNAPYYIFNLDNGGWVIVADDDINAPILAYSDKSNLDPYNLPPQFKWWLKSVSDELNKAKNLAKKGLISPKARVTSTQSLYAVSGSSSVGPLLNTSWGQGRGYNEYCPKDSRSIERNGHVPAGCVAVAMAQIMNYYAWPPRGLGSNSYIPASNPQYGRQYVNFEKSSYSWGDSAKAKIIYHSGVAVNMDYGPNGSSSYISAANSALRKNFRYKSSSLIKKSSDAQWDSLLINSLNNKRPVLYQGRGNIVHVFVCDGYKRVSDGYMYHFNWGWGGRANGWFRVNGLSPFSSYSFNQNNYAIFDIYPNDPNYNLNIKRDLASLFWIMPIFIILLSFIGYTRAKSI
jgi:hypothetical protein